MRDPVTTASGITYDRESIEQWLLTANDNISTCPVTKQPLPEDSDITPNHTLRRLIQAWCVSNADHGVDHIPTPKSPLDRSQVLKLLRDLSSPLLCFNALKKMDALVNENGRNIKCMAAAGVANSMVLFIITCFREGKTTGLEEALRILHNTWSPTNENKQLVKENLDFIQSIIWILQTKMDNHVSVKTSAVLVLKMIIEVLSVTVMERLKIEFFKEAVNILREKISQQVIKAVLYVLIEVCPWGRNRIKIVEAGAVSNLIEIELGSPEKKVTEMIFCLLRQLCSCADGRAQLSMLVGLLWCPKEP